MASCQGLRQQSFRTKAGTALTYDGDLIACAIAVTGVSTNRTRNGHEIGMLQTLLTSTKTDLPCLQAEYAASVGATSWEAVGTMVIP